MSQNGEPQVIQPQPGPCSFTATKVGKQTLETGDQVDVLRISIYTLAGCTIVFMSAPEVIGLADMLREQASGLTIATDLGGITP